MSSTLNLHEKPKWGRGQIQAPKYLKKNIQPKRLDVSGPVMPRGESRQHIKCYVCYSHFAVLPRDCSIESWIFVLVEVLSEIMAPQLNFAREDRYHPDGSWNKDLHISALRYFWRISIYNVPYSDIYLLLIFTLVKRTLIRVTSKFKYFQ